MSDRPEESFPLSWPTGWVRTPRHKLARAKFSAKQRNASGYMETRDLTIYAAMRRLTDELGRLNAKSILISTNVPTTKDGQPRSERKAPDDVGVACYFKIGGKDRVLACDKWNRVADNIAAIAAHVDCIRGIDRYGVGTLDQAFAGYAALPPPGHIHKRPWRDVLGDWNDIKVLEAQYRAMARDRHPDAGGSHEQMAELNEAITDARRELAA